MREVRIHVDTTSLQTLALGQAIDRHEHMASADSMQRGVWIAVRDLELEV